MLLTPTPSPQPRSAQTWNSAHPSAGDVEARSRVSEESLGFSRRNVQLGSPPFISGPACLPVHSLFLPIYPEKPGGKQPSEVGGLLL